MSLRVYGIVLLMCPEKLDKQQALAEYNLADKPVFVSADVEDDLSPLENARVAILGLDMLRSLPGCLLRAITLTSVREYTVPMFLSR